MQLNTFNINDYNDRRYVMHCETETEAKHFCHYLHSIGKKWRRGESYDKETYWTIYQENTVYFFHEDSFGDINTINKKYIVLKWKDFDFTDNTFTKTDFKKFTKTDFQNGDIILFRNKEVGIYNDTFSMILLQNGWCDFNNFNSNLKNKYTTLYDIIAVRRPKVISDCHFNAFKYKKGKLVFSEDKKVL